MCVYCESGTQNGSEHSLVLTPNVIKNVEGLITKYATPSVRTSV